MRNLVLVLGSILVLCFIVNDARSVYKLKLEQLQTEQAACSINYKQNKCHMPVPLTELECKRWEICIEKDVKQAAYDQFLTSEFIFSLFSRALDNLSTKSTVVLILLPIIFVRMNN